jgi:hypothetical protein
MTSDQFEIVDIHMHAWPKETTDLFYPHKLAVLDQRVFDDTLAQMDADPKDKTLPPSA